jgi:hypothetical protein
VYPIRIQNKRLVFPLPKPSSLIRWGFFISPIVTVSWTRSGRILLGCFGRKPDFFPDPVFLLLGYAEEYKKNYKVVIELVTGWLPQESIFTFLRFLNLPNFFSFFLNLHIPVIYFGGRFTS